MAAYSIDLRKVSSGFDGKTFWAQARAGAIPRQAGEPPMVVVTAQPTLRSGSDVFYALSDWRSTDYGATWDGPVEHAQTLGRRQEDDGVTVAICDMEPDWHAASGRLLTIGHTVRYADDTGPMVNRRREVAYAVHDPERRQWSAWQTLALPDMPSFANAGAGSNQRIDLDDGSILVPIYYREPSSDWHAVYRVTVLHCAFDGERMRYLAHGNELSIPDPRGLCEPSLIKFGGRIYLTLRNDVRGYVASSDDGLTFSEPRPWCFDDGTELGNYNTQQHWLSHGDTLYLVYTRRGLDNDHVFRHRAPLVMAEVDPENLVIRRATEQVVVPNRGARLGNFSICRVDDSQSWVVVSEWMQPVGCEAYGSDNTIWVSRLLWS